MDVFSWNFIFCCGCVLGEECGPVAGGGGGGGGGGGEKMQYNFSQYIRWSDQESNQALPE